MLRYIKNIAKLKAISSVQKKSAGRKVISHSLKTARTIGIMTTAKFEEENDILKRFKKIARDNKLELKSLIYYPEDRIPDKVISDPGKILFNSKQCNWYGKPQAQEVIQFISIDFDILLDLTPEECFPLQFVMASSKANFKVGCCTTYRSNPFDFLMSAAPGTPIEEFIHTLCEYLSKFKAFK